MRKSVVLENYKLFCEEKAERLLAILNSYGMEDQAKDFKSFYDRNINKAQPEIMVHGIYNAGKSTLINALVGKEVAPFGDVPLTCKIDKYEWNGYQITDTPGVDAPIKGHEEITKEHLKEAEVVIFVMSAGAGSENIDNYKRMVEIIESGKRLLIVVNDKSKIPDEVGRCDLKNKAKINLMTVAKDKDMVINEKDYDVIFVNAQTACVANKYNEPDLLKESNLQILEQHILKEIKRVDGYARVRTIVNEINNVAAKALKKIVALSNDDIRILDDLKEYLKDNQKTFKNMMCDEVSSRTNSLQKEIAMCIEQNANNQAAIEDGIQKIGETCFEGLQKKLNSEVNIFLSELYIQFETQFENSIANQFGVRRIKPINLGIDSDYSSQDDNYSSSTESDYIVDLGEDIGKVVDAIPRAISARKTFENTMFQLFGDEMMKYAKEKAFGGMIKHVVAQGTKHTVGKFAAAIIPVIGPAITGISLIFDAIGIWNSREQRERERALKEAEFARAREEARVEAEKMRKLEIMNAAANVSSLMLEEMKTFLINDINNIFITLINKINTQAQEANSLNEKLTDTIDALEFIIRECEDYTTMA